MNTFQILLWIWTLGILINIIWYKLNPKFIDFYYEENFKYFDFYSFLSILYVATIIMGPVLSINIIIGEIKGFFILLFYKSKLKRKIKKLNNEEIKNYLNNELKKIV